MASSDRERDDEATEEISGEAEESVVGDSAAEADAAEQAPDEEEEGDEGEDEAAEDDETEEDEEPRWWEDLRDLYLGFDRRTLGLSRIFLGFFLIFDLWRRTADWWKMYSNEGVLPTHYNLWRPQSGGFSIFNAFSTREELWVLWGVGLCIYLCLLVGYKTRIAQVLAAIFVASMNGRILLIENGGYVVHNLLMLWTAFLPLGDRFSLDALLASWKNQPDRTTADLNDRETSIARWRLRPHVTLVSLVILLQLSAIYFFNVIHKKGPAWHDGTAVHYVLYVDRMVNPLIGAVREHVPWFVIILMTRTVMALEAGMTLALFSPLARVWAKRFAIVFLNVLHIGFGSTFVLGPFAWALCVWSTLLFSKEDWELAYRTMRRTHRARTVLYHPRSRLAFFWCRLLKRMDRFELLTFRASKKVKRLGVARPDGTHHEGRAATADILCALPLGPLVGAPMRLPLVGSLLGAFAALINAVVAWAIGEQRSERKPVKAAPVGYRPELKDDPGHPTIDASYMHEWLEEHTGGRWGKLARAFALMGAGFFSFVWLAPTLKRKLDVNINRPLWGEGSQAFTLENGIFWAGMAMFIAGGLLFAWPFLKMNLATPSPVKRKWIRVLAFGREGLVLLFWLAAMNQAVVELWTTRTWGLPQPELMQVLSHKMRYLQGWFMFSPNPVMDDGVIVCDAITVDGRRIDPFRADTYDKKLGPPDYDLLHAKSYAYNQIWSDYFNRMHMPANTAYRKPMKEYIFRLPERTGNPDDAIVKGTVYWVHDQNPRWRRTESFGYNRKELFNFTNPDPEVQRRYREITGGVDPPEIPLPVPLPAEEKKPSARSRADG